VPGDPVPTVAPAAVFNLSTGGFDRLVTNLSNASALAYDPGNGDVYATVPTANSVVVVDPRTGAVVGAPIPVGTAPSALALDPNSNQLFVANAGSSNVTVVNTLLNKVTIPGVSVGSNPVALVDDSLDSLVFVANGASKFLTVLNITHPATLSTNISLYDGPAQGLAFSPASDMVIAAIPSSQYATIVVASAETPLDALLPVGKGVVPSVVSANGTEFILGNASGGDLLLLNSSTGSQIGSSVPVERDATELAVDPLTGTVYGWTSENRVLEALNLTNGVAAPVTSSAFPEFTSVSASSGSMAVYLTATNQSLVYSLNSSTLSQSSPITGSPSAPLSVVGDPAADRFFLGTSAGLAVYDAATDSLASTVSGLSGNCSQLVLDRADNLLWFSNSLLGVSAVNLTSLRVVISTSLLIPVSVTEGIAVDNLDSETFVLVTAGTIAVLDSGTGGLITSGIHVGANVTSLAFDPADDQLYAAGDDVSMVDGATLAVDGGTAPFGGPHRVLAETYDSSRQAIYVASVGELSGQQGVVTVIDGSSPTSGTVSSVQIPVGEIPSAFAVVPASAGTGSGLAEVWVANEMSGTISILSTPPEVTSFTATPATIDLGYSTAVAVAFSGGAGELAFAYEGLPAGCSSTDSSSVTCTPAVSGVFQLSVNVTDSLGASANASTSLTVLRSLTVQTALAPSTLPQIDAGVALQGTASASNGLPPYSFGWAFGDGSTGSGAGVSHAYANPGDFVVTTQVRDATGASANASSAIVVVPRPSVDVGLVPENVTDVDFPVSLSSTVAGGTGSAGETWLFGDGTMATGANATHAWTRPGNYPVTFRYVDALGVAANASVNVTVHPSIAATFSSGNVSSSTPALVATPVLFTSTISGGTPPYSVTWSFGDGSMATGRAVSHSYAAAGSYTVAVTLRDAVGATLETNLTVAVASASSSGGGIASVGGGFAAGLFLGLLLGGVLAAAVLFVARPRKGERPPPSPGFPYVPP
jgi:DNA-binding beta-propeller fold protein YncE